MRPPRERGGGGDTPNTEGGGRAEGRVGGTLPAQEAGVAHHPVITQNEKMRK